VTRVLSVNHQGKNILISRGFAVIRKAFAGMEFREAPGGPGWQALRAPLAKM
jgi:hypothetical protein